MTTPEEHIPPLGETATTKDLLWQVASGKMRAAVVFSDPAHALRAQEIAKNRDLLGYHIVRELAMAIKHGIDTQSDVDIPFGLEFFGIDGTCRITRWRISCATFAC